jgi:PAS domain S-box-containing protein
MIMEVRYIPSLVVLSVFVAILASFVALNLAYSVTQAQGRSRSIWLGCGALAMGVGIWSMHFVGMLAFEMPGMDMAYDVPLMFLSVAVAVGASALALFVVSRPTVHSGSLTSGGIAMAAAIAGMHYIGMYSMRMSARIQWNVYLVSLSVLIALVASFAALAILTSLRNKPERFLQLGLASTLMGVAISGMHYTGMIAATFVHDDAVQIKDSNLLVTDGLSFAVIATTLLILGIALLSSIGQRMLVVRQKRTEEVLSTSEEKFRILVEAVRDYAICMIDPTGLITTWNSGAQRITGYTETEIVGKHISNLYTNEDLVTDTAGLELRQAIQQGHFEGEALRKRKDGTRFWANVVINPLNDKNGALTGFSMVTRDITQFKEAADRTRTLNEELEKRVRQRTLALQEREAQLRTITNAIPILVAQMDSKENILFANGAFCQWFNCTADGLRNLTFKSVLGDARYPLNKPYINKVLAGETVMYERQSKSGNKQAILNITFVPEFDQNNSVKGFIFVAADVSQYKSIEVELKGAKEAAEVANATKSAFLANMSHEIRTPLGAVLGFSELLVNTDMTPSEKQNAIEIIKRNGKLLSTIINDILDLSKVEAGKLVIDKTKVELFELLHEIVALLNLEAAGKGIRLNVTSEGVVPHSIKTDPTRLRQILFNLVGNAIKFTDHGTVNLKVRLAPNDASKLEFIVKDTGVGIAPDQATRLFSPFTQADATTTRKFGGTGLGLVLSKKLANALGGDVSLEDSKLGQGSTFIIRIDHGQSEEIVLENRETPKDQANVINFRLPKQGTQLTDLRVLIVDDSMDNLVLVKKILNLMGAKVETANNGSDGVTKALQQDPDVVLMDLQMPEMDGYAATKELRKKGFAKPIIALTAHAMKEDRRRCLSSGFDDHLTKPVDRGSLMQTLTAHLA